jgi:hypothetical protein
MVTGQKLDWNLRKETPKLNCGKRMMKLRLELSGISCKDSNCLFMVCRDIIVHIQFVGLVFNQCCKIFQRLSICLEFPIPNAKLESVK